MTDPKKEDVAPKEFEEENDEEIEDVPANEYVRDDGQFGVGA